MNLLIKTIADTARRYFQGSAPGSLFKKQKPQDEQLNSQRKSNRPDR